MIEQIDKQLNKLIEVIKVTNLSNYSMSVYRELALVKVSADSNSKLLIIQIANTFRGNIVDMDDKSMIIEITGNEDKISAFIELMRPYGIKESIRTGLTALSRGKN